MTSKRLIVFVSGIVMGSVLAGEAVAAPPQFVAPPSVAADVVRKRDAGWKLTQLGELVAARVPVKLSGSQGMGLLATTDDPALLASSGSGATESPAAATAGRPGPTVMKKRATRKCIDKNSRRLAMTAGAGFVCTWGQRANVQWTSQSGGSYTRFTLQDMQWKYYSAPPLYGYCQQLGCFWSAWHIPPSNAHVAFVEVENAQYARIDNTWCG